MTTTQLPPAYRAERAEADKWRLTGPGIKSKSYPRDAKERLEEIAEMLSAAYAAGVEAGKRQK